VLRDTTRRVYATPFLERAGRMPLGQALDLRRVYVTPFLEWAGCRAGKLQSSGQRQVIRESGPGLPVHAVQAGGPGTCWSDSVEVRIKQRQCLVDFRS